MGACVREQKNFNGGWKFHLGDCPDCVEKSFDDTAWKALTLPHDWGVDYPSDPNAPTGGGGGYAVTGVGWYRKVFSIPPVVSPAISPSTEGASPKPSSPDEASYRTFLRFDGVFMDSTVYLDGKKIGGRAYGYSEFTVDLSCAEPGEHTLAVRVNNALQPNSRWYTGSGIYRNVWLITVRDVHIDQNGVFIITNSLYDNRQKARLQIQTWVKNDRAEPVNFGVTQRVLDHLGNEVAVAATAAHAEAGGKTLATVMPVLEHPRLWSVRDPYLYSVETIVTCGDAQTDRQRTRIGVREAVFDADRGFLLNGEPIKIKGMCLHHDGGLTGAASYTETWERRLRLLKDMGCNGIRCAHNPPALEFLDLCDELGFLVMDEAFDEWQLTKIKSAEYGYSANFAFGYGMYDKAYSKT